MSEEEAEDRTQGPSKLRRQQAREGGHVAHSAELTGAAGLLAAVLLLGVFGGALEGALRAGVRAPLQEGADLSADPAVVVGRMRSVAFEVAWPLGAVLMGAAAAAVAAHQAQVRGLWAPGRLAPDPSRLWSFGRGPGLAGRGGRGVWSVLKTVVVVAVGAWALRSGWQGWQRLGGLGPSALVGAVGATLRQTTLTLAVVMMLLGAIDFAIQYRRFEDQLRLTPQAEREEMRAAEGDPGVRARRRRIARTWRGDSVEVLSGASVVLTGAAGLSVVLAGGPPPRRVAVRTIAQGVTAARLRRAAETAGIACVEAPKLALRLARRRSPTLPLTADLLDELARAWPPGPLPEKRSQNAPSRQL